MKYRNVFNSLKSKNKLRLSEACCGDYHRDIAVLYKITIIINSFFITKLGFKNILPFFVILNIWVTQYCFDSWLHLLTVSPMWPSLRVRLWVHLCLKTRRLPEARAQTVERVQSFWSHGLSAEAGRKATHPQREGKRGSGTHELH